jgi:broad-specificity NMP kinase
MMPSTITRLPLPVIHINGFPGTGKLTIAQALVVLINRTFQDKWKEQRRQQQDCIDVNVTSETAKAVPLDARLIHNHLLIDPAGACLPRTSPAYQSLRYAIRSAIFDTLITAEDTFNTLYVFTDFQSCDELGSSVVREYLDMAQARNSRMVPIILTCKEEEHFKRLTSTDRGVHGKLVNLEIVRAIRQSKSGVFRFQGEEALRLGQIEIDVTKLTAEEAAAAILEHVLDVWCGVDRLSCGGMITS